MFEENVQGEKSKLLYNLQERARTQSRIVSIFFTFYDPVWKIAVCSERLYCQQLKTEMHLEGKNYSYSKISEKLNA